MNVLLIDDTFIESHTHFPTLVDVLKAGFAADHILVPQRHHHDFPNPEVGSDSTLLLMPAWNPSQSAGVKLVTVSPENSQFDLPAIQGTYVHFDATTGVVKALLDAKSLTAKRTAAASALASSFLSRADSSTLLMIGTGALSSNLILAHAAVRPIKQVYIWGRNFEKAKAVAAGFDKAAFTVTPIENYAEYLAKVDIISCATLSKKPLIKGDHVSPGQHLDLVGSYKKDMREADDVVMSKAAVFLDTYQGGLQESGDILIPLENGSLKKAAIKADLFELCRGTKPGRIDETQLTVFKSVGYALEDLVAADYYVQQYLANE